MLRAGMAGLVEGAEEAGFARPIGLAVTVLTSDPDTSALDARMRLARAANLDGVVCAGTDVERAREYGLRTMVPASGSRAARRTTRCASTLPATRFRAARTGS